MLTPSRWRWNSYSRLYHRFDNVWGKETIDGIEVYSPIMYYWAGSLRSDKKFKLFINAIGIEYETLRTAKYEGVDNVYFKLEPNKYSYAPKDKEAVADDLNAEFSIDDEFELYVHYTGESRRILQNHYTLKSGGNPDNIKDYTIDKDAIRAELESNPMKYFANAELVSAGVLRNTNRALSKLVLAAAQKSPRPTPVTVVEYDENTTSILATLALLDNGSMFQKLGISSEIVTVKNTTNTLVYFEYSYKVKYKVVAEALTTSYVVGQIDILSDRIADSLAYKGGNIYAMSNHVIDTKLKEAVVSMNNVEDLSLTYDGKLRVDAAANMKRKEFADMLSKSIGTGYTKKKSKWYEKALAIIIIVVAVVVGVMSGGGLAAVSSSMMSAAIALGTASAVATIGLMMYAAAFPYATDMIKIVGSFAQITGLAAMVTGVYAAIQQSWQAYVKAEGARLAAQQGAGVATEEGMKAAMAQATAEANLGGYVNYLFNNLANSFTGQVSNIVDSFTSFFDGMTNPSQWTVPSLPTMSDVSGWLQNLNTGMGMYMKFFGEKPLDLNSAESEQATKEDGVEPFYSSIAMIDEVDALHRLDFMIKNNNGGQMTENYMVKIT